MSLLFKGEKVAYFPIIVGWTPAYLGAEEHQVRGKERIASGVRKGKGNLENSGLLFRRGLGPETAAKKGSYYGKNAATNRKKKRR